jgi:predicted anti-sigma-YlaC factor YlaD
MQLTCAEVRNELVNYMENDVTPELRQRLEEHVLRCGGCKAVYDGVRNVIRLLRGDEVIELPEGFSRRLRERVAAAGA